MADYKFKIDDRDFKIKIKKIQQDFPDFIKKVLVLVGNMLLAKVKKLTPVDTGLLRKSWFLDKPQATPTESKIEIKNNVKYAAPQEFGFNSHRAKRFIPGKFMLRRGFDEINSQAPQIIEKEIQDFIDKNGGGK